MTIPGKILFLFALVLLALYGCGDSEAGGGDAGTDAGDRPDGGPDSDLAPAGDDPAGEPLPGEPGPDAGEDAADSGEPAVHPDGGDGESDGDAGFTAFGVLSLNLHCLKLDGTDYANNSSRLAAVAQAAAAEEVRVLLVQEACRRPGMDAMEILAAALADSTGATWSHDWVFTHTAWAGTPDEAEEGIGLLSMGELLDTRELEYFIQGGLLRRAAGGRLPAELGGLRVWSIHLEVDDQNVRLAQARQTASATLTTAVPSFDLLVGGDFNAPGDSPPCQAMRDYDFLELSDGLGAGLIDHLYAHRGAAIQVLGSQILFDGTHYPPVSDHPGVLVRIGPGPAPSVTATSITAHIDVGFGNAVFVRGNVDPLDWQSGWPAVAVDADRWLLVFTKIPAGESFEYKCLLNDDNYQTGPNMSGLGGADNQVSPQF